MKDQGIIRTVGKLTALAVLMFGFGYLLVPIYNVFCEITGINGKTGTITQEQAISEGVDKQRLVTVEFDANVNGDLPWDFKPEAHKLQVHPGEVRDALFTVENKSGREIIGQAIPSVAPNQASLYFNKTECFCFSQQILKPHERKEMLVRFVVDRKLPDKISTLTLSYTFFMVPEEKQAATDKKENRLQQEI